MVKKILSDFYYCYGKHLFIDFFPNMYQNNFVFFKYIRNFNLYIDTYISIVELVESIWNVKKKRADRSLKQYFVLKKYHFNSFELF